MDVGNRQSTDRLVTQTQTASTTQVQSNLQQQTAANAKKSKTEPAKSAPAESTNMDNNNKNQQQNSAAAPTKVNSRRRRDRARHRNKTNKSVEQALPAEASATDTMKVQKKLQNGASDSVAASKVDNKSNSNNLNNNNNNNTNGKQAHSEEKIRILKRDNTTANNKSSTTNDTRTSAANHANSNPTTKSVVVSVSAINENANSNSSNKITNENKSSSTTGDGYANVMPKNIPKSTQEPNELEVELEKNYIFKIKKNAKPNNPARYRCNVCNYFCDTVEIARKHINGQIHRNNMDTIKLEMKIRDLEMPSKSKVDYLTQYLVDFYRKNVITTERIKLAYDIYNDFKAKLNAKHPEYQINIYGSMAYGVCFNDSNCDICVELLTATSRSPCQIIKDINEVIMAQMTDVLTPFGDDDLSTETRSNKVMYRSKSLNVVFNFTTGLFTSAYKTSTLLRAYMNLDERARVLALCLRYIAKIASIDKVDLCTLPAHSYVIMAVYFLQRLNPPVLPVLHEIIDFKCINTSSAGQNMTNDGSKSRKSKRNRESMSVDELNNSNTNNESLIDDERDHHAARLKSQTATGGDHSHPMDNDLSNQNDFNIFNTNLNFYLSKDNWKSENTESLGSLWVKMLTFYSIDFGFKKTFISIRKQTRITKSSIKMYSKKMSIEDPFYFKQSLSKNLINQTNKYIINVLSKTCLYFVLNTQALNLLDSVNGPLSINADNNNHHKIVDDLIIETGINDARKISREMDNFTDTDTESESDSESDDFNSSSSGESTQSDDENFDSYDYDDDDVLIDNDADKLTDRLERQLSLKDPTASPKRKKQDPVMKEVKQCLSSVLDRVVSLECKMIQGKYSNNNDCMPQVVLEHITTGGVKLDASHFKFTINALGIPKSPPKVCSHCNKEGHLQFECPQDKLPKLEKLPDMTEKWRHVLDKVFQRIYEENRQTREEERVRSELLKEIQRIVWQKYPQAQLSLFGSSNNGFAMKKSDLDICMTLDSQSSKAEELNFKRIIRNIGALFRREPSFDQIEERVSAKVPIVKFRHNKTNIEGDISLYNTLALQNTDLLRAYAQIDERTRILGYVVKHFAKICRIGDASCGSLSSYAYIVMMLHYLMNTEPPVLPCLQCLNREKVSEQVVIDGWDCWFNRDIHKLSETWPHHKKNTQSVGQLWVGFLRYYTETFDWDNHVVCIRLSEPLTRKVKNWTKHRLAIEDPFELSHNLAAGVSHKMGLYILKSFSKARYLFGMTVDDFIPDEVKFNIEYFFNPRSLVDGNPPMDRNCYSCFKIGHQTKDCPLANAKRRDGRPFQLLQPPHHTVQGGGGGGAGGMFNNQDDLANIACFKCKIVGHKARDCPYETKKRAKAVSVSVMNDFVVVNSTRCFRCSQTGHIARDCTQIPYVQTVNQRPVNNKPSQPYTAPPLTAQQQQQFAQLNAHKIQIQPSVPTVPHQKSAPAPKMIKILPAPNGPNSPVLLKSGDSYQLFVNSTAPNSYPAQNVKSNDYPISTSSSSSSTSSNGAQNQNQNLSSKHAQQQQSFPMQYNNNYSNNFIYLNNQQQQQQQQQQSYYPVQHQLSNNGNSNPTSPHVHNSNYFSSLSSNPTSPTTTSSSPSSAPNYLIYNDYYHHQHQHQPHYHMYSPNSATNANLYVVHPNVHQFQRFANVQLAQQSTPGGEQTLNNTTTLRSPNDPK